MPNPYNGNTSGLSGRPTVTISEPVGTDTRNALSVQTPLRKLADLVQYLMTNAAFLGANVFTATQQISSGALELTQAAAQAILKAGSGKLQVGTKAGNNSDLELLINGVVKAALLAAGGFDVKSQRIVNVTDPSAAQDADTKAARDAAISAAVAALASQSYVTGLPGRIVAAARPSGSGTVALNGEAFGFSSIARIGGEAAGGYQLTPSSVPRNPIVLASTEYVGTISAQFSGGVVLVRIRDASGAQINHAWFNVAIVQGA
jgi:hypothetical protein